MGWEQLTATPQLLREGQYMHFVGGWGGGNRGARLRSDTWARVLKSQQIKYEPNRLIVASASTYDLAFQNAPNGGVSYGASSAQLSLLPARDNDVYEILMGLRGNLLVYPMYNNQFFLALESTLVTPTVTDANLRYLGFWDEDDSPWEAPVLREYTIQGQEWPVLRLYNDHIQDEILNIRFVVNRLAVEAVGASNVPDEMKQLARVVKYHDWFQATLSPPGPATGSGGR